MFAVLKLVFHVIVAFPSPVCAKSSTPFKSGERRKLREQEDQLHKMVNQAKEVNITRSTLEKKGTNKKEGLNYSVNTLSLQEVIDRVAAPRTRSFSASDAKRRDIMGSDEENTPKSRNVQTRQTLNNKKSPTQGSPCLRSNLQFSSSRTTSGLAPHPKAAAASRESTPESDAGYGTSLNMSASPDESLAELLRSMKLKSGGQEGFKGSDGGSVLQHQLPPISETDPAVAEAVRSPDPLFPQPLMPQGPNLLQTLLGFPSQPQPDMQQQLSTPYYPTQHLLPPFPTGGPLPGAFHASPDPFALERAAKQNRNAASVSEVACTWSGQLPPPGRTRGPPVYSTKVFLGGVPWDLTERCVQQALRQFGPVKVEWPGKGKGNNDEGAPKGYVYLVLEKEGAVPALLSQVLLSKLREKMTILASSALWTTLEEEASTTGFQAGDPDPRRFRLVVSAQLMCIKNL